MNKKTVALAFRDSLPVMAGYVVLGIGFGILLRNIGLAWYWSTLMSIMVYAGSMQYVAVELLAQQVNLFVFAIMTVIVNARHLFYGITMLVKYRDVKRFKSLLLFLLTDETFSIVCAGDLPEDIDRDNYYLSLSLFDYSYWVIGSTIGALTATFLEFNSAGVEFSMTALFVVTFISQWENSKNHSPALIGLGVSALCLFIFGSSNFLIPSMITITALLLVEKKVRHE